jgi:ATP-binding cassette subfamily A (ABC1) protein 1
VRAQRQPKLSSSAVQRYIVSFLSIPAHLFFCISYATGFGGTIVGFLLWFFGNGWNQDSGDDDFESPLDPKQNLLVGAKALTWTLRVLHPSFNLANGLFYVTNLGDGDDFVKGGSVSTVWHKDVLLYEVIFLILQSVLYLLLAIQIDKFNNNPKLMKEWRKVVQLVSCRMFFNAEVNVEYTSADDDDVAREQERVDKGEAKDDLIVLRNLSKMYDNGKLAVNNLSLGIPRGECFGLLGINGAGKTTTMSMLTTEFPPTSGDAVLAGFSIRNEAQQTRTRIGYCVS